MKKIYWIQDIEGVKARVVGAEDRDYWTRVHGWTETTEPTGLEMMWVRHVGHGGTGGHGGKGVMNAEAAKIHEGMGWAASGPEGYDEPDVDESADTEEDVPAAGAPVRGRRNRSAATASGETEEE